MKDPDERRRFLIGIYLRQLKSAGLDYVFHFEMLDGGNRTEYFLVFATHSKEGLKAMKAAMWKADPAGRFRFSDASVNDQLRLIQPEPDYYQLKQLLVQRFSGAPARIEAVEDFVVVETPFRETHFRNQILRPMEKAAELEVVSSPRKGSRGYPPGTVILIH